MYFLSNFHLRNDDYYLYPSLFYLLGWATHNERFQGYHGGYYGGYDDYYYY